MALLVNEPFETPYGYVIDKPVWRFSALGIDVRTNTAIVVLMAWIDVNAMAQNKEPIGQKQYQVTGQQFAAMILSPAVGSMLTDVVSNAVYSHVKATDPYFANAVEL